MYFFPFLEKRPINMCEINFKAQYGSLLSNFSCLLYFNMVVKKDGGRMSDKKKKI